MNYLCWEFYIVRKSLQTSPSWGKEDCYRCRQWCGIWRTGYTGSEENIRLVDTYFFTRKHQNISLVRPMWVLKVCKCMFISRMRNALAQLLQCFWLSLPAFRTHLVTQATLWRQEKQVCIFFEPLQVGTYFAQPLEVVMRKLFSR